VVCGVRHQGVALRGGTWVNKWVIKCCTCRVYSISHLKGLRVSDAFSIVYMGSLLCTLHLEVVSLAMAMIWSGKPAVNSLTHGGWVKGLLESNVTAPVWLSNYTH
jgi:hypothetical protein